MTWSEFLLTMRGRTSRKAYWLFALAVSILSLAALVLDLSSRTSGFSLALNILIIWPSFSVSAKRWHDRDKSAWWMLIFLVPVLGALWTLVECGFLRGTDGPNRFGDRPLAPAAFT